MFAFLPIFPIKNDTLVLFLEKKPFATLRIPNFDSSIQMIPKHPTPR